MVPTARPLRRLDVTIATSGVDADPSGGRRGDNGAMARAAQASVRAVSAETLAAAPRGSSSARVLRTAATLFRTKGYAGTSTRDIAAAIGWQSASLYHHMGQKEDLLYALFLASYARLRGAVEEALARETDPVDRIRAMIGAHLQQSLSDVYEYTVTRIELCFLTPRHRAKVASLRHAYGVLFAGCLREAQRRGALRRDLDVDTAALSLLLWLHGCILWVTPELEVAKKRGRRGTPGPGELIDVMTRVFLEGVLPRQQLRGLGNRKSRAARR